METPCKFFRVNYTTLNKITVKDEYSIPHIDDLLDELRGSV